MANTREGFKRIMGEISTETHEKILWYNKISPFSLNISKAIEICLTKEVKKIELEAIDFVKENRGIARGSTEDYNNAVEGIKAGLPVYDIYKLSLKTKHINPSQNYLRSEVYLPLLPINKMQFNEEKQKVCFFVDKLFCYSVSPYSCDDLDDDSEEDEMWMYLQ